MKTLFSKTFNKDSYEFEMKIEILWDCDEDRKVLSCTFNGINYVGSIESSTELSSEDQELITEALRVD